MLVGSSAEKRKKSEKRDAEGNGLRYVALKKNHAVEEKGRGEPTRKQHPDNSTEKKFIQ